MVDKDDDFLLIVKTLPTNKRLEELFCLSLDDHTIDNLLTNLMFERIFFLGPNEVYCRS